MCNFGPPARHRKKERFFWCHGGNEKAWFGRAERVSVAIASSSAGTTWPAVANTHAVIKGEMLRGEPSHKPSRTRCLRHARKTCVILGIHPASLHLARPCAIFDRSLAPHTSQRAPQCAAAAAASPPYDSTRPRLSASPVALVWLRFAMSAVKRRSNSWVLPAFEICPLSTRPPTVRPWAVVRVLKLRRTTALSTCCGYNSGQSVPTAVATDYGKCELYDLASDPTEGGEGSTC